MRTLTYSAKRIPANRKKSARICILLTCNKIKLENIFEADFAVCEMCSDSEHVFTFRTRLSVQCLNTTGFFFRPHASSMPYSSSLLYSVVLPIPSNFAACQVPARPLLSCRLLCAVPLTVFSVSIHAHCPATGRQAECYGRRR